MGKKYLKTLILKENVENISGEEKNNCVKIHFKNENVCFSTLNICDFEFKVKNNETKMNETIKIKDLKDRIVELETQYNELKECVDQLVFIKNCSNVKNLCLMDYYEVTDNGKIIITDNSGNGGFVVTS